MSPICEHPMNWHNAELRRVAEYEYWASWRRGFILRQKRRRRIMKWIGVGIGFATAAFALFTYWRMT